jgi:hypothetical protein
MASGAATHKDNGKAEISIPRLAPGAYRLIYKTTDDFGAKSEMKKDFIVAALSMKLPLPAMLSIEESSVKVGGKARILAHSGLKDQYMVFEIFRDGKCIRREDLTSGENPSLLEIPITEEDRGGLEIRLVLVRDNQFMQFQKSLSVPWDNKELNVEFSTFRDRLQPGHTENWSVKVSGPEDKNVAVPAAELLAYMYDRSLDAFAPHLPANPLNLYPRRNRIAAIRSNLMGASPGWMPSNGFKQEIFEDDLTGDQLMFDEGSGIGGPGMAKGMDMPLEEAASFGPPVLAVAAITPGNINPHVVDKVEVVHSSADADYGRGGPQILINTRMGVSARPPVLRSDFSETAFWQPHLLTGPDGSVTFEFIVPDSVTSWNVWIHAITKDFMSGSVKREAQSVKELMVRPYIPLFLREGDQAELKVVVNNASDHEINGLLNFDIIDVATDQSILSDFGLSKSDASGKSFTIQRAFSLRSTANTLPLNAWLKISLPE